MSRIDYAKLNLKISNHVGKFTINDLEIEVFKYLPIRQKYDLIMVALEKSQEDGFFNPIKLCKNFYLNLIYLYTNIDFSTEDRVDEDNLFDELSCNGIIDKVLECIDKEEFENLLTLYDETLEKLEKNNNSIAKLIQSFTTNLPNEISAVTELAENFDPEKFKAVMDFAAAANGGRPIGQN